MKDQPPRKNSQVKYKSLFSSLRTLNIIRKGVNLLLSSVLRVTFTAKFFFYNHFQAFSHSQISEHSQSDLRLCTMKTSLILHPNHLSIFILLCFLTIKVSGNSIAKDFFKPSNSEASFSSPTNPKFSPENSTKQVVKAIVIASVVSLTIIFLLGCTIFLRARKRNRTSQLDEEKISYKNKELGTLCCHRFSLNEIKTATNNFDADLKIGDGGFGTVYKGFIDGRETPVAIKVLNSASSQGPHEFWTEVETLSKLRNPNLVSLIGYCNDQRYMIIVYDYMAHGTLRDHLYGTKTQPLTWKQRLEICIGAARGLVYLHAAVEQGIIHRDVKTSNILLDENWVAKVSDFGLSRLGPESPSRSHVSTDVKGTFGYLDPEYYWTKELTPKSDVYGFGVVMFEVLCGRPAVDMGLEDEQQSLARWARYNVKKGTLDQIIDENLRGEISPECLKLYGMVAVQCLRSERKRRPKMADVLRALEFALGLQESAYAAAEKGIKIGEESTSDEKMTCWGNGGNQVVVRSTYKHDVVHSCPAMWKKSNSQRMLLRFFSDKVGLRWATQSTSRALIRALCFTYSCTLVKYPHGDGSKNEK